MNKKGRLILVDGSAYIFRAFYGLPSMSNNDGVPVNAVFGYTKMLLKLIDDFKPVYVAVIFDVARKTFRNDLYELYKANRSEPPEELIPQFSIIRDAIKGEFLNSSEKDKLHIVFCKINKLNSSSQNL